MPRGIDATEEQETQVLVLARNPELSFTMIADKVGLGRATVAKIVQRGYRDVDQVEEARKRLDKSWRVIDRILDDNPQIIRDEETGKILEIVGPRWVEKLAAAKMVQELVAGQAVGTPQDKQEQSDEQLVAIISRSLAIIEQAKKGFVGDAVVE